jgi:hypothetical protein
MDFVEMGWGDVDWIGLAQDRYKWRAPVKALINIRVLQNAGKRSSSSTTGGLSYSAQLNRLLLSLLLLLLLFPVSKNACDLPPGI